MTYDTIVDLAGGLQREDLADLELAKKKQNVLLKQLLAMPGRDPMLGLERRSSEVRSGRKLKFLFKRSNGHCHSFKNK